MRANNKVSLTLMSCAIALSLWLSSCQILEDASQLEYYKLGVDTVPSVNAVIGETRSVTSFAKGTEYGVEYIEICYESSTVQADLTTFLGTLLADGWMAPRDFDLNDSTGQVQVATESMDSSMFIWITVTYDQSSYTLLIKKMGGDQTSFLSGPCLRQ